MSKLRQADRGYWIVLAICFLAIWPFLKHASLPHDTDAELHIFRLAELQRMWAGGTFYPRWAANFYYGFGYPIFNYYAPLTYYIGLLWMLLPGVGAVLAIKLVFITAICGAGLSMYSFVRDEWGAVAGFVAAASYVYAPYILYVDSHARGVVPETFSFAIFPLALMLLNRLRRQPSATNFASASVAIACVILVHNLMAMVFGTLLFA
ncbi:MAG: 6-pyruvoyl-tetrahydropterin synthase-related protein, partial [Candidatus Promineifilaceae bacterium]